MTNSQPAQVPADEQAKPRNDGACSVHPTYWRTVETECLLCRGEGSVWIDDDPGMSAHFERCWQCGGRGVDPFLNCPMCLEEEYDDR